MRHKAPIAILIGCTLALVACGDDDDDSPEDAAAAVCADRVELAAAVEGFTSLDFATATVDQAREAADAVNAAVDQLRDDRGDLAEAEFEELEDAYETLDDSLSDLSGDETLPEAGAEVLEEARAVEAAQDAFFAEVGCTPVADAVTTTTAAG